MLETIVWKSVDVEMPDDDMDVLLKTNSTSRPVWIGVHDGDDGWRWANGVRLQHCTVTHWADMPGGPEE